MTPAKKKIDWTPRPKVAAAGYSGGLAGATVTIVLWAFSIEPPTEVTSALVAIVTTVFAFAGGYMREENP